MKYQGTVVLALCTALLPIGVFASDDPPKPVADDPAKAKEEQQKKEEQPEEHPGLIKRSLHHFFRDDNTPEGGRGVHFGPIAPRAVILSSGGGPGPFIHLWAPDLGNTPLDFHASAGFSIFKYQYYDAQFGLLPQDQERLPRIETSTNALFPLSDLEKTSAAPGFNLYASARYRDYPREDYYGIGPNTSLTNHADYRLQDGLYEGVIRYRISKLSLMGRGGILHTSILAGQDSAVPNVEDTYSDAAAPGLLRAPDFIVFGGGGWLELRDVPGNPHRGASFGLAYAHYDERNGDAFKFSRVTGDAREYIRLGSNRNVIALRETLSFDQAAPGREVPFYLRSSLGGSGLLRAYHSFRFRDDRLLYLSGEYRFEIRPKVEIAALYEGGKVYPEGSALDLQDLRRAYGVGIRLKSPRKVHVRLDVMHGQEGTRIHLKLGPSF